MRAWLFLRAFCSKVKEPTMKVLNVAEKNDAAKNIAHFLSNGNSRRREGLSKFNKIYDFQCQVFGQNCTMMMTSVSGHLLGYEFIGTYKSWHGCSPEDLFEAPIQKVCPEDFVKIKKTLEREARGCQKLIIWTDCDREGENIGYEIINTCLNINPRLDVYRAKFSEITGPSVKRALANLIRPNKLVSDAVDVRSELDLRIGAAFTRFQTLRLQKVFPVLAQHLLSYGPCQFPTLGFVVERYMEREKFIGEAFWSIRVSHTIDDLTVEFRWHRNRLFDKDIVEAVLARCRENESATVEKVESKPKSKWRPTPLDTTEMEKIGSRKLKITAKEVLKTAEKLYTKGFISYPRTETNIFPSSIDLNALVELQTGDGRWGAFARRVLEEGANPRQGRKSDQSHPPIHPIKYTNTLDGNEGRIYEFIVRHFLACVSKDAKAEETNVVIDINTEKFQASGLMILERNYLDVYPYETWNTKVIHAYRVGQIFRPTVLDIVEGQTTAPNLLTEADLITLMEKHGIGTDATHAEHIDKIKSRFYVGLENRIYFVPSAVGMGLVEGYDTMGGFPMSKPIIRAELEADLVKICEGTRQPDIVLTETISKYRELFRVAKEQVRKIDEALSKYTQEQPLTLDPSEEPTATRVSIASTKAFPCPLCGQDFCLRTTRSDPEPKIYVGCTAYPNCRASMWFPRNKVLEANLTDTICENCGPGVRKIEFKFVPRSMVPYYPDVYVGCVNNCDDDLMQLLDLRYPRAGTGIGIAPSQRSDVTSSTIPADSLWPPNNPRGGSNNSGRRPDSNSHNRGEKRSRPDSDDNDDDDHGGSAPRCYCGAPAKRLTVRKAGPNIGREFYVCVKDGDDKCSYYAWADELGGETINCSCSLQAKKLVVKKDGPNQGRTFYTCPRRGAGDGGCQFFQWEDETNGGGGHGESSSSSSYSVPSTSTGGGRGRGFFGGGVSSSTTSSSSRRRGGGRGGNSRGSSNTFRAPGVAGQRKCGICGQLGHNRRNCPNNGDD